MAWDEETIGQRIRRLREERGLTQKKLGSLAELSEQSINRLETGVIKWVKEFGERLAKALDVPEDYLLNGDSHAERETTRLIESLSPDLKITPTEAARLREMASRAIKQRNNARIPLNRLEVESLLMVIRGS